MNDQPPPYPYPSDYDPAYPPQQSSPPYPPQQSPPAYPSQQSSPPYPTQQSLPAYPPEQSPPQYYPGYPGGLSPQSYGGQQPYIQAPYGGAHYHTQNTVVVVPPTGPETVVVEADPEVNDCYTECACCCDNACGRCCAKMWRCDKYHKWYSMAGKGVGWILPLLFFYLIAGTVGLVLSLCVLAVVCMCLSGAAGD
ncbi:cysteine-rich and transmembrane domain-containing protein 1-like [Ptychodera flava]|uniref:cysteine-rich and transmembrane domain-containing protein 1-like n=1 Tax=Ptychodera flava TaxID=63121 RepID=UPI003969F4D4